MDDAIVVIENTERNMTQYGLSPKEAAKHAMTGVSGALIAIVRVLNAVLIPVVFSGIVALTLSPALAATLIKPGHGEKHGFFKWFEKNLERATTGYVAGASANSRHSIGTGVIGGMLSATAITIFFVPMFFLVLEKPGVRVATNETAGIHDDESGASGNAAVPTQTPQAPGVKPENE